MKLQVTQENLNKALASVSRVASTRGTLPILANVLLKTVNNRLSIVATNLDIAITYYVGTKVAEEGAITVPARLMQDFINSLPHGVIDLSLEDYKLHIEAGQYKSTINGIAADEYPEMPVISAGNSWTVAASDFKKTLQQVVGAASSDEARPVLTGIYIWTTPEGDLCVAATDSHRLAEKTIKTNTKDVSLLVPVTAMQDLLRLLSDYDGDMSVTHDEQQVLFETGDAQLVARLIDGKYPDYKKLIPSEFSTTITLPRTDLLNVTKVSSLFARESAGSVTIHIDEDAQKLSIQSVASQLGENVSSADGKVSGSGSITLNSKYLLDALQVFAGDQITLGFNGKLEPVLLSDSANKDYIHIIMPLKS